MHFKAVNLTDMIYFQMDLFDPKLTEDLSGQILGQTQWIDRPALLQFEQLRVLFAGVIIMKLFCL
jgi:hypothetical protein